MPPERLGTSVFALATPLWVGKWCSTPFSRLGNQGPEIAQGHAGNVWQSGRGAHVSSPRLVLESVDWPPFVAAICSAGSTCAQTITGRGSSLPVWVNLPMLWGCFRYHVKNLNRLSQNTRRGSRSPFFYGNSRFPALVNTRNPKANTPNTFPALDTGCRGPEHWLFNWHNLIWSESELEFWTVT